MGYKLSFSCSFSSLIYIITFLFFIPCVLYSSTCFKDKEILLNDCLKEENLFNKSDSVYIIKTEIDLNGRVIAIPKGCSLIFNGGSFKNGTIIGDSTRIYAKTKIFKDDVVIKGSWLGEGNPLWFGAIGDGIYDCSNAFQKCADTFSTMQIAEGVFLITKTINLNKTKTIKGGYNTYSRNVVRFSPKNNKETTLFKLSLEPNYFSFEGVVLSGIVNAKKSIFENGTTAIDTKSGACIKLYQCYISGFENGVVSNFNSYYNLVNECRFSHLKCCFVGFSPNNFIIKNSRFQYFSHAFYKLSGDGQMVISENSFENFSGSIIYAYYTLKNLNFINNYVEPRDSKLPNQLIDNNDGKYGGGFVIQGNIKVLNSFGNELQINTAKRMYSLINPNIFNSVGNKVMIDTVRSNLERYYVNTEVPKTKDDLLKSFTLKDCIFPQNIPTSQYNAIYKPVSFIDGTSTMLLDAFDPIIGKLCVSNSNSLNLKVNSNGWQFSERAPKAILIGNVIHLLGNIHVKKQTQNVEKIVAIVPSFKMPVKQTPKYSYVYLNAMDEEYNKIVLKYNYKSGEIEYVKGDKSKGIVLDGCQIIHSF